MSHENFFDDFVYVQQQNKFVVSIYLKKLDVEKTCSHGELYIEAIREEKYWWCISFVENYDGNDNLGVSISGEFEAVNSVEAEYMLLLKALEWFSNYPKKNKYKLVIHTKNIYIKNCVKDWLPSWNEENFAITTKKGEMIERPFSSKLRRIFAYKMDLDFECNLEIVKIQDIPKGFESFIKDNKELFSVYV